MAKVLAANREVGFIFEGRTPGEVLRAVWAAIKNDGRHYLSQRGPIHSIKGAVMIITDPLAGEDDYPYWRQADDEWYQDNFVRKETNQPPEAFQEGTDVYPYKYAWRSRYYDGGWGHVKGVTELFRKLGYQEVNFQDKTELLDLLRRTYQLYHPENILAVLAWKGKRLLDFYLKNPQVLEWELQSQRRDTLLSVIEEIKKAPASRRAIIPSFTYEHIDHSGMAGGVPVYQNYQLYAEFDEVGNPVGLISLHLHRAMDALGGTQLDISHDREWGLLASRETGLPLRRMVIYANDIYYHVEGGEAKNHQINQADIRSWLFFVTDGYDPKVEDIEKRLTSPIYRAKIDYAWERWQSFV
jgi:thymidylate synthase